LKTDGPIPLKLWCPQQYPLLYDSFGFSFASVFVFDQMLVVCNTIVVSIRIDPCGLITFAIRHCLVT
jgi:hypothetical protein